MVGLKKIVMLSHGNDVKEGGESKKRHYKKSLKKQKDKSGAKRKREWGKYTLKA